MGVGTWRFLAAACGVFAGAQRRAFRRRAAANAAVLRGNTQRNKRGGGPIKTPRNGAGGARSNGISVPALRTFSC
jgi:hypothetical protein